MRQQYPHSSEPQRLRPLDYSRYLNDGTEWVQTISGVVVFFAAFAGWYPVARRLPYSSFADTPRNAWLAQAGWVAICLAALLVIDLLARSRWGWDRFRVGLILGLFAAAGFWIARAGLGWWLAGNA
jgi:hypothetical protein